MSTPRPDDALVVAAIADLDHPIKAAAADWARTTLGLEDMRDRDRDSVFFREAWAACADYGLQASIVPVVDGGAGDDIVTTMLKLEGLGLGCVDNGLGFALASQMQSSPDWMKPVAHAQLPPTSTKLFAALHSHAPPAPVT